MAWILVHALDLDYYALHQKADEGPSCFRGRQEALPTWDGSPPVPVPQVGLIASFSDPQLWRGRVQTDLSYDKKDVGLLA